MYHRCNECGKLFDGNTEKGYIMNDVMWTFCDEDCCTSYYGVPYVEMYDHEDEENTPVFWTRDEEDDIESLYDLATDTELIQILAKLKANEILGGKA